MDVTEHPTGDGKVYLAVVLDAFSRRVVGWSIADHVRAELVVDAVQMAIWRRHPPAGQTVAHSDHGSKADSTGGRNTGVLEGGLRPSNHPCPRQAVVRPAMILRHRGGHVGQRVEREERDQEHRRHEVP